MCCANVHYLRPTLSKKRMFAFLVNSCWRARPELQERNPMRPESTLVAELLTLERIILPERVKPTR
jgi:hypothetical protein